MDGREVRRPWGLDPPQPREDGRAAIGGLGLGIDQQDTHRLAVQMTAVVRGITTTPSWATD